MQIIRLHNIKVILFMLLLIIFPFLTGCGISSQQIGQAAACLSLSEANLAVHTGASWEINPGSHQVTVYRDNPPLMGLLHIPPGKQIISITGAGTPYSLHGYATQDYVWDGLDYRFAGSQGYTYQDNLNPDGFLGITPLGPRPFSATLHWHTNGLQLLPGKPLSIQLQERQFIGQPYSGQWTWQNLPAFQGTFVLDPRTWIDAVEVIVVNEPNHHPVTADQALAQLWFDGRTVDRLATSFSSGGSLNSYIADQDPRPNWNDSNCDGPKQGATDIATEQDPDGVWCYCGIHYAENIQFQLVHYDEISATVEQQITPTCAGAVDNVTGATQYQVENCIDAWVNHVRAHAQTPFPARVIPIIIVPSYGSLSHFATAQAFSTGIIIGESDLLDASMDPHPGNILAHELGHFLGFDRTAQPFVEGPLFEDGAQGPHNLMADDSPILTREQCDVAWGNAKSYTLYSLG